MNYIRNQKDQITGRISKENLDIVVVDILQKGQKVEIPDLGYLELTTVSDKFTVLFKATNSNVSFEEGSRSGLSEDSLASALYRIVTIPLKEGKTVSMPQLGIFRPIKKEDDTFRVSFVISSYLRGKLKGSEWNLKLKEDVIIGEPKSDFSMKTPLPSKSAKILESVQTGEVVIPSDVEENKPKKNVNIKWILLASVFVVVFVVILFFLFDKKEEQDILSVQSDQSTNLLNLAEEHYGNSVFWVYIYEANREKLSSPVNIPKGIQLIIPDLTEYNVDIKDTMEIKRAKINSEIILKRHINVNRTQK
jgi:nucleoid DNA-binding protein